MEKHQNKGFTLAELLVVIAIIAIIVAIAIPVFTSQIHKAKVSADLANLRSYYSEIQLDYQETGKYNPKIMQYEISMHKNTQIEHLNGSITKLQDGYFFVSQKDGGGYQISYYCNDLSHFNNPNFPNCTTVIG